MPPITNGKKAFLFFVTGKPKITFSFTPNQAAFKLLGANFFYNKTIPIVTPVPDIFAKADIVP